MVRAKTWVPAEGVCKGSPDLKPQTSNLNRREYLGGCPPRSPRADVWTSTPGHCGVSVLPSSVSKLSAPTMCFLSRLNGAAHPLVVYASRPESPPGSRKTHFRLLTSFPRLRLAHRNPKQHLLSLTTLWLTALRLPAPLRVRRPEGRDGEGERLAGHDPDPGREREQRGPAGREGRGQQHRDPRL